MKTQSPRGVTSNPIRDDVLRRMLKMPPKPHKPRTKPRPGSRKAAKAERRSGPE